MIENRIIIIGDLHFGSRKNNKVFHDILMKELNWSLTKIKKDDSVVILGDIFDSRSNTDFKILNDAWGYFITLSRSCKEVFIVAGNHDEYYKNVSRETTNCRFLEFEPSSDSKISPVKVITGLEEITIANKRCLLIPWIDSEDKLKEAKKRINSSIDIVFGHFDMVGLYHNNDPLSLPISFSVDDFKDVTHVFSGHYHKRMQQKNVTYVGSFINTTFNDLNEIKGVYILDEDIIEFVPNSCPKFHHLTIDNPLVFINSYKASTEEMREAINQKINGNFIKLFLNEYKKENEDVFKLIKSMEPMDIHVTFNRMELNEGDNVLFDGFDTKTDISVVLTQYIDSISEKIPSEISPDDIKSLINKKNLEYKQTPVS
jgi:DNA repair exonuclease SbcCD nuclease subunit